MIQVLTILLVLASVSGRPQQTYHQNPKEAVITKYDVTNSGLGEYSYKVETSDGQRREESRTILLPGTDREAVVVRGYYSYLSPDGQTISVTYIADENGFRAEGYHLPNSANAIKPQVAHLPRDCITTLCGGQMIG